MSFPALLNHTLGGMEYLLVTGYGKTHESVLKTDVDPAQIQVALLLLDAKGASSLAPTNRPSEYGGTPGAVIQGDPVRIEVSWEDQGRSVRRDAEELLVETGAKGDPSRWRWVFNGSTVWKGSFLAKESGSVMALIADPIALINLKNQSPGAGGAWHADTGKTPPENVPVTVKIILGTDPARVQR